MNGFPLYSTVCREDVSRRVGRQEWVVKVSILQWAVKVVVLAKGFVGVVSAVTVNIGSAHSGNLVLGG